MSGSVMFSELCQKLVHQLGKDTLIPVQSLDDQGNVKLLQLVVMEKKRHYLFWHKNSYSPTPYKLTGVLKGTTKLQLPPRNREMRLKCKLSLKAEGDVSIPRSIVGVDFVLTGNREYDVMFGKLIKTEVLIPELVKELKKRKLNLENEFFEQFLEKKNKVLYLITGVVHSAEEAHIRSEISGGANATIPTTLAVNVNIEQNQELSLDSGQNSALAYNVHELQVIRKDGSMKMIVL